MRRVKPTGTAPPPSGASYRSKYTEGALYHGTAGPIKEVKPSADMDYGDVYGPQAWAAENPADARSFAFLAARNEGRLFGSVYEVSPKSGAPTFTHLNERTWHADHKGMDVVEHVGFGTSNETRRARNHEDFRNVMSQQFGNPAWKDS